MDQSVTKTTSHFIFSILNLFLCTSRWFNISYIIIPKTYSICIILPTLWSWNVCYCVSVEIVITSRLNIIFSLVIAKICVKFWDLSLQYNVFHSYRYFVKYLPLYTIYLVLQCLFTILPPNLHVLYKLCMLSPQCWCAHLGEEATRVFPLGVLAF